MACKWRIRHKMAFGMALVVGIMAILLTGTLKGLQGYRFAMRAVESKLAELEKAVAFKDSVNRLLTHRDLPRQAKNLKDSLADDVRAKLDSYRAALNYTVATGRADDGGFHEFQLLDACDKILVSFDGALDKDLAPVFNLAGMTPDLLAEGKNVRKVVGQLMIASDDLISAIKDELMMRVTLSRREQRAAMIILVSTSVAAVFLMIGILRFFYTWVVKPIRLLEQGVSRVARGDFEHRIVVKSGDEIESFAGAYNDMAARLNEMYGDLAQQVNERSRQLVRSERLAGVGFLAAGVAHEINNPLASIAFCSEALEARLGELLVQRGKPVSEQDREIIHKYLKMIQEEAFRCKEITQKLLAFSRGGDRKRERTDLTQIIQGVLDMVQHVPNSKGKSIRFQPAGPLEAWVNAQEIKQVFLNLVVNALDSMEEGGVLTISHSLKNGVIDLAFQDTGCGMTPEVLENIFEPFFTRSRTGKGTGLGLSISHRIITQHGGEIEAASAGANQGSRFIIRLPVQSGEGSSDEATSLDPEEEFLKLQSDRQHRRAA